MIDHALQRRRRLDVRIEDDALDAAVLVDGDVDHGFAHDAERQLTPSFVAVATFRQTRVMPQAPLEALRRLVDALGARCSMKRRQSPTLRSGATARNEALLR